MNDIAMFIAKHLHLDMARALNIFFNEDMRIAERCAGLTLARGERVGEVRCVINLTHPLTAAPRDSLNQHWISNLGGLLAKERRILIFADIARGHGHTRRGHQFLGGILQAHCGDARRVRPHPDQASIDNRLRKFRIFREEAIAGMDCLCASRLGSGDDLLAHQIAFPRRRRPDMHRRIGFLHMQRLRIGIRIDRYCADSHFSRRADNPESNLAPIGDEERLDHELELSNTSPDRGGGPPADGWWWRGWCSTQAATIVARASSRLCRTYMAGKRKI